MPRDFYLLKIWLNEVNAMKNLKLHSVAFQMIKDVEELYHVDSIALTDGTKLWNLLRIVIFYYFQKGDLSLSKNINSYKKKINYLVTSLLPISFPKRIDFCGFSGTESRKLWRGKYFDIYMDPLYEVLGETFTIFEWPNEQGYRIKYNGDVYSKNYVPMYIPVFTKTFWKIVYFEAFNKSPKIINNMILTDLITYISAEYSVNKKEFEKYIYSSIGIFLSVKFFLKTLLEKINPKGVIIRCGYTRFHMALSQACKELGIPTVEVQHGFITRYSIGYVKATNSLNRDCLPDYFLSYGNKFSEIVKKGNLFDSQNVASIGFPYLAVMKGKEISVKNNLDNFITNYRYTILITSDSLLHIALAVEDFSINLSKRLDEKNKNIGIIFKPHPFDKKEYQNLQKLGNVYVADKQDNVYHLMKIINVHSTVFSTCAIEALAFGKPNIVINIKGKYADNISEIIDQKSSFIADNVDDYIMKLNLILLNYDKHSKEALQKSFEYFKGDSLKNLRNFINRLENET
ncbi:MAG: CDP-glycerol glycerophosphotransferase family protein [Methanomicrobia archaeon]|nr:CDP-glycerol glycerophosphotransferase family protein [Methanomicrobia archaeon]